MNNRRHDNDSVCRRFLRCSVIFTCFLSLLGGVGCLSVGLWVIGEKVSVEQALGSLYTSSAYILIAVGSIVTIISFLGCFGAARRNKCILNIYFVALVMMFLIILIAGILGFLFVKQMGSDDDDENLLDMLKKTYGTNSKTGKLITDSWDYVQTSYACCGFNDDEGKDFKMWEKSKWFEKHEVFPASRVPATCCKTCAQLRKNVNCSLHDEKHENACNKCPEPSLDYVDLILCQAKSSDAILVWPNEDFIHLKPCKPLLVDDMTIIGYLLGALGVGFAVQLIIAMILAVCLYRKL